VLRGASTHYSFNGNSFVNNPSFKPTTQRYFSLKNQPLQH
jgi:hypothetical protein